MSQRRSHSLHDQSSSSSIQFLSDDDPPYQHDPVKFLKDVIEFQTRRFRERFNQDPDITFRRATFMNEPLTSQDPMLRSQDNQNLCNCPRRREPILRPQDNQHYCNCPRSREPSPNLGYLNDREYNKPFPHTGGQSVSFLNVEEELYPNRIPIRTLRNQISETETEKQYDMRNDISVSTDQEQPILVQVNTDIHPYQNNEQQTQIEDRFQAWDEYLNNKRVPEICFLIGTILILGIIFLLAWSYIFKTTEGMVEHEDDDCNPLASSIIL